MQINLLGQRNLLGAGRHFSSFCDAFKLLNVVGDAVHEFDVFSREDYEKCMASVDTGDVNIHFFDIKKIPSSLLKIRWPKLPGTNWHWAIFESDKLFPEQVAWYADADLVLVPSKWGKQVLAQNGIEENKVAVVPEGVDANVFHPSIRKFYRKDNVFRVLVLSKFEPRKGFPELLKGFSQAFSNDNSAQLVLKADSLYMLGRKDLSYNDNLQHLTDSIHSAGITNFKLIEGALNDSEIFHLYNHCDLFLFPSRAEGWGLPLIEAIASGMPILSTNYSGHSEFLNSIPNLFVELATERAAVSEMEDLGYWACSTEEEIATKLKYCRANLEDLQESAYEASSIIRQKFNWREAALMTLNTIRERNHEALNFEITL